MKHSLAIFYALFTVIIVHASERRPNVLFIAIDDLNDWIGCMGGHPQALTPNMDRLAKEGVLFTNAHCQAPICGPSRASIMTGLAPATTGIYLQIKDRDIKQASPSASNAVFLPDWFESQGYRTMGAGKIYHSGDGAKSFDEFYGRSNFGPKPKERVKWDPEKRGLPKGTVTDWAAFPESDNEMPDFKTATFVVDKLEQSHDQPFFLAAGFVRPHVPWYVPQKWFDLYDVDSLEMPPYKPGDMDDVPTMGQRVADVPMMPKTDWAIENGEWKNIVHAYLACVSFVDAQVGKVLDALRASEHADNTVVVLWSDHGYHLGEKGRFAKQAIWEPATKTVLMFKAPDVGEGQICDAPVQLLDLYPTLLDLCSLEPNPDNEGRSLVPLLENPNTDWNHLAVTSYGVGNWSLRSRTHRYIVYEDGSEELYDMVKDPEEWTNLARSPEMKSLKDRFRSTLPETQAPISKQSTYSINAYWRDIVKKAAEE